MPIAARLSSIPALLVACVLGLGALAASAHAQAAPTGYTIKTLHFDTVVGPNHDTHCDVVGDLYKPDAASSLNPAPAILTTNGFGGSKDGQATFAKAYAKRGYVVLSYSGLGFGGSQCKIELDDPDWDGQAGSQLVTFLGGGSAATDGTRVDYVVHDAVAHDGHPHANDPRVGMIGGSYGGEIQFSVAGQDPRVDAIVPQITWNDLAYSLAPNNTDFAKGVSYNTPGTEKTEWTSLFFAVGVGDTVTGPPAGGPPDQTHLGPCPNFDDRACQAKAQMDAMGYPQQSTIDLARHASVVSYMQNIRIPTLLAQGQADTLFNTEEAVATYKALRAQNTPVKMIWKYSGHSDSTNRPGESDETNPETTYLGRTYLEWFDYYLKGIGDPPALNYSWFQDWVKYTGDAVAAYGQSPTYPATTSRLFYLSGSDALTRDAGGVQAGSAQFAVPPPGAPTSYSETSAVDQTKPPTDAAGTFASFSTPPLTEDMDVVGIPRATFRVSAPTFAASQSADPGSKLVLFVKLYDVSADGSTITLVHRLIAPIRVADVNQPVTVAIPGIVHRFPSGDTLRLVIAASDAAYKNNNLTGPVSVVTDRAAPGLLVIPRRGVPDANAGLAPAEPGPNTSGIQRAGAGGPRRAVQAARLSGARACVSRRGVVIRLSRRLGRDRVVGAVVTVNGRRVRAVRGRRLRVPVRLVGLPRGTFRVVVTVRTARGRSISSARTYHTCRVRPRGRPGRRARRHRTRHVRGHGR